MLVAGGRNPQRFLKSTLFLCIWASTSLNSVAVFVIDEIALFGSKVLLSHMRFGRCAFMKEFAVFVKVM